MSAAHMVYCPSYASYFGFLGAASALVFGNMGAAYGTWKSAVGMAAMAKLPRHRVQPEMVIKSMLPVIMAGVCGIYGLIIAVIIANGVDSENYSLFSGCVPLICLCAGGTCSGRAAGHVCGIGVAKAPLGVGAASFGGTQYALPIKPAETARHARSALKPMLRGQESGSLARPGWAVHRGLVGGNWAALACHGGCMRRMRLPRAQPCAVAVPVPGSRQGVRALDGTGSRRGCGGLVQRPWPCAIRGRLHSLPARRSSSMPHASWELTRLRPSPCAPASSPRAAMRTSPPASPSACRTSPPA